MADTEEWLPVPGYRGIYEVSNRGRLRSLDRVINSSYGASRRIKGCILKAAPDDGGYPAVELKRDGTARKVRIHVLVARAFIGPRPAGADVLHGPNGKLDNSVGNLSYGSRSQNLLDTLRDGTNHWANQTHCCRNHLLAPPNLVLNKLKHGHRFCLACTRAHSKVTYHRARGVVLDLNVEADRYYDRLMASS